MESEDLTASVKQRLMSIQWNEGDYDKLDLYGCLLLEYVRRIALCLKTLDLKIHGRPFFDLAEKIDPEVRASFEIIEDLSKHLRQNRLNESVVKACIWSLHWAALSERLKKKELQLINSYEPLIVMFENGGTFRVSHEGVDILGANFQIKDNWISYAERSPFIDTTSL